MKQSILALVVLLLAGPVSADELFVRNRPFQGLVEGTGVTLSVELRPLAEMLDLGLEPANAGWVVFRGERNPDHDALAGPDLVVVEGVPIPTRSVGGVVTVPLDAFLEPLPFAATANVQLGTVDVYPAEAAERQSGTLTGPGRVVAQYYEACHYIPEIRTAEDFIDHIDDFTRGLREFKLAIKPYVTARLAKLLNEKFTLLDERAANLRVGLRHVRRSDVKAHFDREPQLKRSFEGFLNSIASTSWMRVRVVDEEIDGGRATVTVLAPVVDYKGRRSEVPIKLQLINIQGEWLIDDLRSEGGGGSMF